MFKSPFDKLLIESRISAKHPNTAQINIYEASRSQYYNLHAAEGEFGEHVKPTLNRTGSILPILNSSDSCLPDHMSNIYIHMQRTLNTSEYLTTSEAMSNNTVQIKIHAENSSSETSQFLPTLEQIENYKLYGDGFEFGENSKPTSNQSGSILSVLNSGDIQGHCLLDHIYKYVQPTPNTSEYPTTHETVSNNSTYALELVLRTVPPNSNASLVSTEHREFNIQLNSSSVSHTTYCSWCKPDTICSIHMHEEPKDARNSLDQMGLSLYNIYSMRSSGRLGSNLYYIKSPYQFIIRHDLVVLVYCYSWFWACTFHVRDCFFTS